MSERGNTPREPERVEVVKFEPKKSMEEKRAERKAAERAGRGYFELTSDPEIQEKMKRKLAEYKQRTSFQAPEVDPVAAYKLRFLKELLENGMLDPQELHKRYRQVSWYRASDVDEALNIVRSYNENDTRHLSGGTGLK